MTVVSIGKHAPSGLVVLYKPPTWSSAKTVAVVKRILKEGQSKALGYKADIKVGHGGTLDPLAEGVLVLGIGKGTKLLSSYLSGSKCYEAVAKLGQEMDTLDCTGKIIKEQDCSHISLDDIDSILSKFRGNIMQTPPRFSALKSNGSRSYDLARKGIQFELEPRLVTVNRLDLIRGQENLPYFRLAIECGGGFYVRSVIADIAKACNGVAHMVSLQRTKQGNLNLSDCIYEKDFNYDSLVNHILVTSTKLGIDSNYIEGKIT